MNNYEKEFLDKYDSGAKFTEQEIRDAIWDFKQVEEDEGYNHRWTQDITTVIQVEDRYFRIDWQRGLTECQENEYWNQPVEVTPHAYEKTITVREWIEVKHETQTF